MSKYTEKIIGRKVYKIRDTSNDLCIRCLGKGYTINIKMDNHFQTNTFRLGCNHCQAGKKFRDHEQSIGNNDV